VGRTRHFVSVQVKSTILESEFGNAYVCTVRGGHKPYPPGSFDFLAAYVVHENSWYIIPEEETWGKGSVTLHPNTPKAKYEEYREAWNLLGAKPTPGYLDSIQGCTEEFPEEWSE
jgi:hypothetical protein